mmetsp:Transcript_46270/g.104487  ORF Transcript_46270/g.104487 Transcript_46270/m.104487 type:complete len:162 (-) Transcript_46270:176-661(-)
MPATAGAAAEAELGRDWGAGRGGKSRPRRGGEASPGVAQAGDKAAAALAVSADKTVGVTFLKLTWFPPPAVPCEEVDSYELELLDAKEAAAQPPDKPEPWRPLTDIGGVEAVAGAGAPSPELILPGLLPGHRYQFRVRALTFQGWTDWSAASEMISTDRRF